MFHFLNTRKKVVSPLNTKGSVLIVALILMFAVALSTIYLSLILVNEVKSTRVADEGSNASYVVESALERALWRLQKYESTSDDNSFADPLNDNKNMCAGDDGGAQDKCIPRCSNNDDYKCNYAATDCPSGSGIYCVAALPDGDQELLYDHETVRVNAFTYTKYNVTNATPVYTKIYNPDLRLSNPGGVTNLKQLNIYWYVDSCSGAEQGSQLKIDYQPFDIDTSNATPLRLTYVVTPFPAGSVTVTCNCNTVLAKGVDESGITMYRCASNWYPSNGTPTTWPIMLKSSTQIPDTNFYRIKFTNLTSGVTIRKIMMTASKESNDTAEYVSNNQPIPSLVEIEAYGNYRGAQSPLDYFTDWKDAYASSTSLFYHD